MESTDGVATETSKFLTASELVNLRKPVENPVRYVIGEKFYTRSDGWLERNAVGCALESFKDTLNQKRAARICDLMKAEWDAERNVSVTSKLKGKFVQHMGHASNGRIAFSPEESVFLLENGCIEILNGCAPLSTEEAYKVILKDNMSVEKYQVYSHLSQLGFVVVSHQTGLSASKHGKRINLDKQVSKRKRKVLSKDCEEPDNKRLTFSGAFSNEHDLPSTSEETSSTATTANSITEIPLGESKACDLEESVSSVHSKIDDEINESNVTEITIKEPTKSIENFLNNVANSATIVNEIEKVKDSSSVDIRVTNSDEEKALSKDFSNEINTSVSCSKAEENRGLGSNGEICAQSKDGNSQFHSDATSNVLQNDIKESNVIEIRMEQATGIVENASNNEASSAKIINEIVESKETSSVISMPLTNSNEENVLKVSSKEINVPISCNKSKGNKELEPNGEICIESKDSNSQASTSNSLQVEIKPTNVIEARVQQVRKGIENFLNNDASSAAIEMGKFKEASSCIDMSVTSSNEENVLPRDSSNEIKALISSYKSKENNRGYKIGPVCTQPKDGNSQSYFDSSNCLLDYIKVCNAIEIGKKQATEHIDNFANNESSSATIVNEIGEFKEASNVLDMSVKSSNEENVLSKDSSNQIIASTSCNNFTQNSKGLEVELETVEVESYEDMCVQPEDADSRSYYDATNYELETTSGQSKNSIDVMNVDSQSTIISYKSGVSRNNDSRSTSNINVTLEDSCSVMDAVDIEDDRDSNSYVMSCSSDNDEVLSVGVNSECSLSEKSQDDEIKLLEVTKKEIKPLAVIDLSSDDESSSDSDDDIQVVKVCNGVHSNNRTNSFGTMFKKSYPCKKEEKNSQLSTSCHRNNALQLSFPNCVRKDVVCIARPPAKYLPPNVSLSKEVYVINFKPKSEQSQPMLWNSYRDMQDYQRARRRNRPGHQPFSSFHEPSRKGGGFPSRNERLNSHHRQTDSSESRSNPWTDTSSHMDSRNSMNHRRTPEMNPFHNSYDPRDINQNFNHRNSPEAFTNSRSCDQNLWLERNPSGALRNESQNFAHNRAADSTEYPNTNAFNNVSNRFSSEQNLAPNPFQYGVPNASAAINSVVSISNQSMNVSMVGNHIVHPPLHSSSPLLPSFNTNLPNLSAIGPLDIMAEVQRTAYSVATSMLSSMFGQNMNPQLMPRVPSFSSFAPPQNNVFGSSQFNPLYNAPNNSSDPFSVQNRLRPLLRDPFPRPQRSNPFPCQYRNLGNTKSWSEVREAVQHSDSSPADGSDSDDIEEVPMDIARVLWDPKNISPLIKPGIKHPTSKVLKTLQVSGMANLLSNPNRNRVCLPTASSIEISFDVYLPGANYKKTCPDVPKHRIIVVRSSDSIPKYAEIAFLQKKWNDGATLQLAVVDNGDISYQSFNSVCLPVLIPHEK